MNNEKPTKKRPILKVPRCETCAHKTVVQGVAAPNQFVVLHCNKRHEIVPAWGFCHEHPEVTAHA